MRGISIFGAVTSWALVITMCACSSSSTSASRVAVDAQAFCNEDVTTCGDTSNGNVANCVSTISILRVSQACANLVASATCAELADPNSNLEITCFPTCTTPGAYACNSDNTITECAADTTTTADGGTAEATPRAFTVDCVAGCQAQNMTYTGVCGTAYEDQTSDQPECWCK